MPGTPLSELKLRRSLRDDGESEISGEIETDREDPSDRPGLLR